MGKRRSRYQGQLSTTQYVIWTLSRRELQTATEVFHRVKGNYEGCPIRKAVSLATVSGILNRLVRGGDAMRVKGFGKRGGYGYVLSRKGYTRYL